MGEDLRRKFLKRISTVGWGARESVQTVLGLMVTELRTQIADGGFSDTDLPRAITFHDAAERLWRDSLASDPPIPAPELRTRLDRLAGECSGALLGAMPMLERAREHARTLDLTHSERQRALPGDDHEQ